MKQTISLKENELKHIIYESVNKVLRENIWNINVKELDYNEAVEFYYRWGRTILVGTSPNDYYEFNINDGGPKNFDDCIKQWKNYNDGQPHFFIDNRTLDWDLSKRYSGSTGI